MSPPLGRPEAGESLAEGGAQRQGAQLRPPLSRRQALMCLGGLAAALGVTALGARETLAEEQEGRVIEIEARRFKFTPNEITLKRGELVTLAFRSVDFVHGFNLADLGIRADLVPGQVTKVRLQPMRSGTFSFHCDNFCGDGHEEMNGTLIVET